MRNRILVISALIGAGILVSALAYAGCSSCGAGGGAKAAQSAEKGVINTACPVLGEPVAADTKYTADYKGKTVGFCCESCKSKFEAEPEKYSANLNK